MLEHPLDGVQQTYASTLHNWYNNIISDLYIYYVLDSILNMLDCCRTVSSKCTEYGAQYSANVLNMLDSIQQMYTACWIASSECIERVQILGIFLDYRHQCTSIDKCT